MLTVGNHTVATTIVASARLVLLTMRRRATTLAVTTNRVKIIKTSVATITHGLWLTEESGTRGAIGSEARSDSDMVVRKQDVDEIV